MGNTTADITKVIGKSASKPIIRQAKVEITESKVMSRVFVLIIWRIDPLNIAILEPKPSQYS